MTTTKVVEISMRLSLYLYLCCAPVVLLSELWQRLEMVTRSTRATMDGGVKSSKQHKKHPYDARDLSIRFSEREHTITFAMLSPFRPSACL